jgi:hypothetical protein
MNRYQSLRVSVLNQYQSRRVSVLNQYRSLRVSVLNQYQPIIVSASISYSVIQASSMWCLSATSPGWHSVALALVIRKNVIKLFLSSPLSAVVCGCGCAAAASLITRRLSLSETSLAYTINQMNSCYRYALKLSF